MSDPGTVALIAELDRMLSGTDVTLLTLRTGTDTLTLRRNASGPVPPAGVPPDRRATTGQIMVTAPCPGVFLARHPLRLEPLAIVGQAASAGATLGLLRVGPLLVEVKAPQDGTVVAVEAVEGDLVGYGSPLFSLGPNKTGQQEDR